MMSTAIPMVADMGETKAGPVSGNLFSSGGEVEDDSFAKSFSESVGVATSSQGKNSPDDPAIALPGLKDMVPTEQLEEVAEKPGGVKEKPIAVQELPTHSELKGAGAGKIAPPQTTIVTGAQGKIAASGTGTTKVEVPAQVEGTADDASPGSPIPQATSVRGVTDEGAVPHVSIADGDQPLAPSLLSGDIPAAQSGTKAVEKVTEGVSLKKPVKAEESVATQKTIQKTAGKIVNAIGVEPKLVTAISTESAIPAVGQVVAPAGALQGEISKAPAASGKVASLANPAIGISSAAINGQARKDIASGAKTSVPDTAMTAISATDPIATPKADISLQRIPAGPIAGGSDGENKVEPARDSGAALLHSIGIVPTSAVPGNTPGEMAPTTMVAAEDARSHTAGLPAALTGQDGVGVGTQSMDVAPRMLLSTPTSLEVGIQNGTHGWLKVRAEMTDGGAVNASVSASSSVGQEMLHRELPALTAYLQEEKVQLNAVVVHASPVAGTDARNSGGTESAGSQTPQGSNEGEQQHQGLRKTTLNGSDGTVSYRGWQGVDEDGSLPLAAYVNGGTWLSVRA